MTYPPVPQAPAPPPGIPGQVKFPFSVEFQTKALALLLRIPPVLSDHVDYLKGSYFSAPEHRYIYELLSKYYRAYRTLPTKVAMEAEISEFARKTAMPTESQMSVFALLETLLSIDLDDQKYITKRLVNFCKTNASKEFAIELVQTIQEQEARGGDVEFEKLAPKIRKISAIGATGGQGRDLITSIDTLPQRLQDDMNYSTATKVPLGYRFLDTKLDGGMGPGQIAFVAAPPGAGKSSLLAQNAAAALLSGNNVMIFTMELSEMDYELRLHQRLCGVGKNHIRYNSQRYQDRVQWMKAKTEALGCRVNIKYYPPRHATMEGLKSYFSRVRSEGDNGKPWVVIVDYIEKINMDSVGKGESWDLIGQTVDEFIAFGFEFGAPVITASQINRAGYAKVARSGGKKHSDKDDIAASWKKVEHADLVLTFDQAEHEKAVGVARIRVVKNRRGADGVSFKVKDFRPQMNMIELDREEKEIHSYDLYGDGKQTIELRPSHWFVDQTSYDDETITGLLRPPMQEWKEYIVDQMVTLQNDSEGVNLQEHYREIERRVGPLGLNSEFHTGDTLVGPEEEARPSKPDLGGLKGLTY